MVEIVYYQYNFEVFWGNTLFFFLVLGALIVGFFLPSLFTLKLVNLIKKKREKNKIDLNFTNIIFSGLLTNILIVIFATTFNLLNKSWFSLSLFAVIDIGLVILILNDYNFKVKDCFSSIKNKFKSNIIKIFNFKSVYFWTTILIAILILFSSFILLFPPGSDLIGHSLYVQLIFEQNTLLPRLGDRISPLIISTQKIEYPLFSHYIAVISYSLINPILNISSPQFMNIYYKFWILILPFLIYELSFKIFKKKKISRFSYLFLIAFTPSFFVLWRWGGYAFVMALNSLLLLLNFTFSFKKFGEIEYYVISLICLVFIFLSHTVVFTFSLLLCWSISFLYIYLLLKKKKQQIQENKQIFRFSNLISFLFIGFVLLLVILKNVPDSYKAISIYIYFSIISLFMLIYWVIRLKSISEKNEKISPTDALIYNIPLILPVLIGLSLLIIVNVEFLYDLIVKSSLIKSALLSERATLPIIDFEFIGPADPLINSNSMALVILVQILANIYIPGLLALPGFILLFLKFKNKDKIKELLFKSYTITVGIFLLIYGFSKIEALSFLAIKFPFAHYLIRYERLFITFLICIAPILSAIFIDSVLAKIENLKIEKSSDKNGFWKKLRNLFLNRKKLINYISFIVIFSITFGIYIYIGYFKTNLFYSNDIDEASEWIIENTTENEQFVVDRYGSWISFTTNRRVSFLFLTASYDIYKAISITRNIIYDLLTDTAREIIILDILGYHYLYLSLNLPNDILTDFYNKFGYYYDFNDFEENPYIDIVYRGETDMILYLNASSLNYEAYGISPGITINKPYFTIQEK